MASWSPGPADGDCDANDNNDNDANDDVNDDDNDGSGDTKGEMTVGDSLWFFVAAHAQPAERRRCLYQTFKWLRHKNTKTQKQVDPVA